MNKSGSSSIAMTQSDTRYFSQRAKHISLLSKQCSSTIVKRTLTDTCFKFSNRTYIPMASTPLNPVGRGYGSSMTHDHYQTISTGRGRTTVPLSAFVLQKDNLSSTPSSSTTTTTTNTTTTMSTPTFVMHDEVQFLRPYFGPPSNVNMQLSSTSHKREVLLSALKGIESGLKTL